MAYIYAVRGWIEISWPDMDVEGVDETEEEHAEKVQRIREFLTSRLSPEEFADESLASKVDRAERYKGGWAFPQNDLQGTEYICYGADIEEPAILLKQVRELLQIDPFLDAYFSIEGEDGEQYRQWLIKGGRVYIRKFLFPDFDDPEVPEGYELRFSSSTS